MLSLSADLRTFSASSFGTKLGTLSIPIKGIPAFANLIVLFSAASPKLGLYTRSCFGRLPNTFALSASKVPSIGISKAICCKPAKWYNKVVLPELSGPNISTTLPSGIPPPIMASKSSIPVDHLSIFRLAFLEPIVYTAPWPSFLLISLQSLIICSLFIAPISYSTST